MDKDATRVEANDEPEDKQTNRPSSTRVKNRRKAYLDRNPDYFGPSLELAGRRIIG